MKRLVSLVLTVALVAATAGCGGGGTPAAAPTPVPDASGGTSAPKVKFSATFLKNEWHGDPQNMTILNEVADRANVEIDWQVYASGTWPDKKNLLLSSGELPDVMYMNVLNSNDAIKYASQGMLMDLTDLIPKYAPRLQKALDEMPEFKAVCTSPDDGRIYSIGRAVERDVQYTGAMMYINKAWLDKLGMTVPTTTDEFYEALKAFKTKDPNGNSQADEIPFTCYGNLTKSNASYGYSELFGSFGPPDAVGGSTKTPHIVRDNKTNEYLFTPMQPGYKDAISYFHKLISEGLWDKESFTYQDLSPMIAKGKTDPPIVGAFMAFDSSFMIDAKYMEDYVILEPLTGPTGQKNWLYYRASNGNISGPYFSMTQSAKGKEEAILRWLDEHFDPTTSVELFLGPVGTTLKETSSGMLDYMDTPEGMNYSEFRYGNAPVHVPAALKAEDWGKVVEVMAEDKSKLELSLKHYRPYATYYNLFTLTNAGESDYLMTGTGKDIEEYVNKMQVKWMTEGGIEKEWDSYLGELKKLGVDELMEKAKVIAERTVQ